ncbi:MAG: hypothetical protein IPL27_18825 [Lewinellaceae bacterium]|nr:hypothetical protein [Lewinellaceae bacterium]
MSYWVCNGEKPVFKVKLKNGAIVKMTSNHRVLTENGWRELGELQVGDAIATPRKLEAQSPEHLTRKNSGYWLIYQVRSGICIWTYR